MLKKSCGSAKIRRMRSKISFPRYGKYTDLLTELLAKLGGDVIAPPPITKHTVELGTKYAPGDICYPFKITLGTLIESVELGADIIIMANSDGWCILRCYAVVQEEIMKSLGYKFSMRAVNIRKPIKFFLDVRRMIPGLSPLVLISGMRWFFRKVREMDEAEKEINKSSDIKIGIIGEVFVCNENTVNMDIVKKLQRMGVFVDRWLCLSNNVAMLFKDMFGIASTNKYSAIARKYFPVKIGGHANENLVKLIRYAKEGYDGAIMLRPFTCTPETVIEPIVERISRDYNIPVLSLSIDESTLETHFQTRIESFVDMLKIGKAAR